MLAIHLTFVTTFCIFFAFATHPPRTLFVFDNAQVREKAANFENKVAALGHKISFVFANERIPLGAFDEWDYDNLVLLSPELSDRFRELSDTEIAAFVNSGRNVFLVATPESPQSIQSLLKTFGVTFTSKAQVFDEFSPSGDSSLMITSSTSRSKAFDFPSGDIQFKGTAFTFSPSPLLFPLAWGSSASYLKSKGKAISYGKDNVLIGALQSRNGARVVFLGSLDMITESLTEQKNEEFIQRVIEWNFKERGLLRNIGVQFHSAANASDINPKVLTVSDQLEYTIQVEEYKEGKWAPFSASDIQLEVIMLDPYIRVTLQDSGNGKFTASFPLPNTFGVYKLQVDYSAEGYSSIFSSEKLPVRPFRHDQYDRFLTAAFPYYTSAISMVIGFLVFSVAFLYSRK